MNIHFHKVEKICETSESSEIVLVHIYVGEGCLERAPRALAPTLLSDAVGFRLFLSEKNELRRSPDSRGESAFVISINPRSIDDS